MRQSNLFTTAAFRLAISFASLFAVSSAVLFAIVYWAVQEFESEQIRKSIAAEVASVKLSAKTINPDALARAIEQRVAAPGHHLYEYALVEASGKKIAGDLMVSPKLLGWQDVNVPVATIPDGDTDVVMYIYGTEVGDGWRLFVAQDTEALEDLRETVANTFALGSAITVALAVLGGVTVSALFIRRIDRINRTARSVMAGAISERMPVRGSGDEFDRLSVNLNLMLDRVESLVGNLKRVSSDIAHDLRTPLTHLRQGLEEAKADARSVPEFQAVVDRSIAETDGILRTFGALLRIAEVESGAQRSSFAEVSLSKLAAKLVEAYAPVAEDENRTLTGQIEPGLTINGDQSLLTQMIANLCENAMRHTPAASHIRVELSGQDQDVLLSISDDGPGIPETERERVFRPFYRLDQSRSTPGSGLGLALVKAIAELHGGSVTLSDAGPGARFEIRLPAFASLTALSKSVGLSRSAYTPRPSRQLSKKR